MYTSIYLSISISIYLSIYTHIIYKGPTCLSARRKSSAGVASTPSERGMSLRETSMEATRSRLGSRRHV